MEATKQAERAVKAWTDTQIKVWDSWFDTVQASTTGRSGKLDVFVGLALPVDLGRRVGWATGVVPLLSWAEDAPGLRCSGLMGGTLIHNSDSTAERTTPNNDKTDPPIRYYGSWSAPARRATRHSRLDVIEYHQLPAGNLRCDHSAVGAEVDVQECVVKAVGTEAAPATQPVRPCLRVHQPVSVRVL